MTFLNKGHWFITMPGLWVKCFQLATGKANTQFIFLSFLAYQAMHSLRLRLQLKVTRRVPNSCCDTIALMLSKGNGFLLIFRRPSIQSACIHMWHMWDSQHVFPVLFNLNFQWKNQPSRIIQNMFLDKICSNNRCQREKIHSLVPASTGS